MKNLRNIAVKANLTADVFIPFEAECIADGESQSTAIFRMIRNRTAYRNSSGRHAQVEVPNRGRTGPELGQGWYMHLPGRVNYSAVPQMRRQV